MRALLSRLRLRSGSGSGSESGDEKGKGKEKETENDYEKRKQKWTEEKMKGFEKAFPKIKEDQRLCKLIAAQYDAEEEHQAWLQKYGRNEFDDDDDEEEDYDSIPGRKSTQQEQQQNRAPDIPTQQLQEMQQDGTRNAARWHMK